MGEVQAAGRHANVFTIAVHHSFADALAAGIIARHGADLAQDPLQLARGMLLLPNSRAVVAVRDAFVRIAGGAILLPRLVALGDSDFEAAAGGALDRIDDAQPLPPVVDPIQRRLILARLIGDAEGAIGHGLGASEALRLADGLAAVLDQLAIEDVPLERLAAQREEGGLSEHRTAALALIQTLAVRWPAELARLGLADRAVVRNRQLDGAAAAWATKGLPTPWLIAAGINTSAPAVARLLRSIAFAAGGTVVLPHIDLAMAAEDWDELGLDPKEDASGGDPDGSKRRSPPRETHPQYHLKLLLDRMGVNRGEVQPWHGGGPLDGPATRPTYVAHLVAPDYLSAHWSQVPKAERDLPGVSSYACATEAEEALTIALAMREAIERPERTVALVTPDRAIATRVAAHLTRWGIVADDSAGQPLPTTPPGALILALADALASDFAPVELLALLSHPLVATDHDRQIWLDRTRELDLLLRGPRPGGGLAVIGALIADARVAKRHPKLGDWWIDVTQRLAPIALGIAAGGAVPLSTALTALRATLDALAGDAPWRGAAGRALATRIEELTGHAPEWTTPIAARDLSAVLRLLLGDVAVRPPQGGHPRLFIWGLIEARLQRADRMILAGLNEGQWPQVPAPDAWLAPGIRRRLGLPGADRQTGLSAHDFISALSAPDVILTRALRQGGAPTIPSRLMLRIEALRGSLPGPGPVDFGGLARVLDVPAVVQRATQPKPAPPVDLRPRSIRVTAVDTLLADPFAWYAEHMLHLRELELLDARPDARTRGNMQHDILKRWLKGGQWTQAAMDALAAEAFDGPSMSPILRAIQAPRNLAALRWVAGAVVAGMADGRMPIVAASEERGVMVIDGLTLTGMPDRIDRLADGSLAIVDYKTGGGPDKKAVEAKHALQLGLIGAMAESGAFHGADGQVTRFEYWRLKRKSDSDQFAYDEMPFYVRSIGKDKIPPSVNAENFVAVARQRLVDADALWLRGDAPFTAKLVPAYAPYTSYNQLMRLEEWYGQLISDDRDVS